MEDGTIWTLILQLSTVGDRAFPVYVARVWNELPRHVTSAPPLRVFWQSSRNSLFQL